MSLNSCTVHSAQQYTWSSVHWVGSGGEEDSSRPCQEKAWPSLAPNSSFDCLQQVWEIWSHVMTTGKRRLDRQGELPDHCNSKLCVDQLQVYQTLSCVDAAFQILQASTQLITVSSSWTRYYKKGLEIPHLALLPVCLPITDLSTCQLKSAVSCGFG